MLAIVLISSNTVQGQLAVDFKIEPSLAITDDQVTFTCSSPVRQDTGAVFYTLNIGAQIFAEVNVVCINGELVFKKLPSDDSSLEGTTCQSLVLKVKYAKRESMQGKFDCKVQMLSKEYNSEYGIFKSVQLTVGDKTPPIETFEIKNMETGEAIANLTELPAGINTKIVCQTPPARPEPGFIVSITGRENRTNLTIGHRVEFDETVPREPKVVYQCQVFNGFGQTQTKTIVLLATYPAIASEVTIPSETPIQTTEEITICSARNNPSKPLRITEIDQQLVQEGYPKYREAPGMSYAYIRLSDKAAEIKDAKLTFACNADDMSPVRASVSLVSTNSAMLTAGIVIAALLAFLIIAAGIAYALKRRSAAPKPASDKSGYGRVNQNDATVTAADNRRVLRSKLDELPSTIV